MVNSHPVQYTIYLKLNTYNVKKSTFQTKSKKFIKNLSCQISCSFIKTDFKCLSDLGQSVPNINFVIFLYLRNKIKTVFLTHPFLTINFQ